MTPTQYDRIQKGRAAILKSHGISTIMKGSPAPLRPSSMSTGSCLPRVGGRGGATLLAPSGATPETSGTTTPPPSPPH